MNIKKNDLVMARFANESEDPERSLYRCQKILYKTWLRVVFIDNDNTFIGIVERVDKVRFTRFRIGEHVKLSVDQVDGIYKDGQFCYSDDVTLCECSGLCRNRC